MYGWNGSGKSTLSTLFEALEQKNLSNCQFKNCEFSIAIDSGPPVTNSEITACTLNIRTFNQSFVRRNIDWNASVKGILLVAEEKIQDKKELDDLQKEHASTNAQIAHEEAKRQEQNNAISKFLTDSSKRTKTSFQVIDTKDSRYFNYNKTKLEEFLNSHSSEIQSEDAVLSEDAIISYTKAARPEHKPAIPAFHLEVSSELFQRAHTKLVQLLKTSAVNTAIARLTTNPDLQAWVGTGLDLHNAHKSAQCEFCGSPFTAERKHALEAHFNEEFLVFQDRLKNADQWLSEQYIDLTGCPNESDLYEELKSKYKSAYERLEQARVKINSQISKWHDSLREKIKNQFDTSMSALPILDGAVADFNAALLELRSQISQHNSKTEDFERVTKQSKERLELHYAASEATAFGYVAKKQALKDIEVKLEEAGKLVAAQAERILALTNSLSDAGVGAEKFNKALHRFLGRSELSLRFRADTSGYEIIRNNSGGHDGNLSEGEKTAIAFVYFIIKLTENNNKLSDTVVVVDDPVSSFDSNHLFHSYSFLRHHCESAKQLFVLTHNFNFYKLVRDWFEGVNKNRVRDKKDKTSFFYVIESDTEIPRSSNLKDADQTLTNYQSEYHYLFSHLYAYREKKTLSRDESYQTANSSRKLLEAFFAFKYPKARSDFSAVLREAQKGCVKTTSDIQEKIYRFINKYSHSAIIEINEDSAENLHGESQSVIGAIFEWIEEVDPIHYREMCEVVSPAPH